jgi:hypothetical protein
LVQEAVPDILAMVFRHHIREQIEDNSLHRASPCQPASDTHAGLSILPGAV